MVLRHWCQNMICSSLKIRLAYKIWVLYLQNQGSYAVFSFDKVVQDLHFTKFWYPKILLKFCHFWLIFCMGPLKILSYKCYIATWGQTLLLPCFLMGRLRPPHGCHRIRYPMGSRVKKNKTNPKIIVWTDNVGMQYIINYNPL